ncbi:PREDICTED: phytolongin Phyl2.1-like [Camelina sativa]|uniref:Phytolongin Phyl2.1-like n=1 Tax=Camelina sativa TaxID=90675 RepID=A0ABM0UY92_CAMSA|nr:PREDICTED: phytolongin Phyl2.1-like [Camelina sativa]
MITNPRMLLYTCIAKGTVILAEFVSKEEEPGIEDLALRCIENVPPHHSMISHTVRKRTYALIIDGIFSYFAILDEAVTKSESLWLFHRLKSVTESLMEDGSTADSLVNHPSRHCLQSKLEPVFVEITTNKDLELEFVGSSPPRTREINNNQSLDSSSRGRKGGGAFMPLLGKPLRVLKNKKRLHTDEVNLNEKKMDSLGIGGNKGVRNGLMIHHHHDHHHRQKAKQIWKKHVWVVLMFDLCICLVLFCIWLWVCQGFQCILQG